MGNFQGGGNRGGGFRGGNGGGGRPSFGGGRGGDRGPVTMHKAVCDECKKSCEVPFRPSGDKPVYCSDCFGSKREDGDRAPRKDFGDRAPRREFNGLREQVSFDRPATAAPANDDMKNSLREINVKLDRLVSAIEKLGQSKVVATPAVKAAAVVAKVEVKKAPVVVAAKKIVAKAPSKKVEVKKVIAKKK